MIDDHNHRKKIYNFSPIRLKAAGLILIIIIAAIVIRLLFLTTIDRSFLIKKSLQQADHPHIIPASRGVIFDRNGVPLAISAPIDSIIFDGKVLAETPSNWQKLAQNGALGLSYADIQNLLSTNANSRYIIAKKNLPPNVADRIDALNIPGIYVQRDQQSFYPEGPAFAQLIGFTDASDNGQGGIELGYDHFLKPIYGRQSVTESALGQTYSVNHLLKEAKDGHDLYLSIDSRLQYVAYQAIATQVQAKNADWGGVVIMNPHTGEVLAAVSYPSYNPNNIAERSGNEVQNKAITYQLEPGSSMKPVTITAALTSNKYSPTTPIDTSPGFYMLDGHKVRDDGDFGLINVTGVITKSSNVGISKIGLSLPRQELYDTFINYGFGQKPSGGKFPGEASGFVYPLNQLGEFQFATMMFGYSISASLVQMARMYSAIANGGVLLPASYVKLTQPSAGKQVVSSEVASEMLKMLLTVVDPKYGGTGILANVPGYTVAGKTGTAHVSIAGGYAENQYNGFFIGIIPANHPQLVIAVVLSKVNGFNGMGGISAAPVFSKVGLAAMHILGIPPTTTNLHQELFKNTQQYLQQLIEA